MTNPEPDKHIEREKRGPNAGQLGQPAPLHREVDRTREQGGEQIALARMRQTGPIEAPKIEVPDDKTPPADAKTLATMWDAAYKAHTKGDVSAFSDVNKELAKAIASEYKTGGIEAVKKLERQIYGNVTATDDVGPRFTETTAGVKIHNVRKLSPEDRKDCEAMSPAQRQARGIIKIDGYGVDGWAEELKPAQEIELKEKVGEQIKVNLTDQSTVFQAADGSTIVYLKEVPYKHEIFYSHDGKTYHEVFPTGLSGDKDTHHIGFLDPLTDLDKKFNISREGDHITMDGKIFQKVEPPKSIVATKLPEVREGVNIFKLPDGGMIYISRNRFADFAADSYQLYVGKPGEMRKLNTVGRPNSTKINTQEGILSMPGFNLPATWTLRNGTKINLTEEYMQNYDISETKTILTLKQKS